MITPAALAALVLAVTLTAIVTLTALVRSLVRADAPPAGHHELANTTDPYRPRGWDEITGDQMAIEAAPADPEPETDAEEPAPEPIDELDPAWDWEAYAAVYEPVAA